MKKITIEQIEHLINNGAETISEVGYALGVSATAIRSRMKKRSDLIHTLERNRENAKAKHYYDAINKVDRLMAGGMGEYSACREAKISMPIYKRLKHKARAMRPTNEKPVTLTQKYAAVLSKPFGVAA